MSTARFARSRIASWGWVSVLAAGLLLLSACSSSSSKSSGPISADAGLDTIKPGVLKVAIQPYAPYTALVGNKLTGLDSDIINAVADKLGLKVEAQVTDFAGMLASVQSHRVDITIGGVAWTAERQKQGLFTDPPYYSPPAMAVGPGHTYTTVNDLEGRNLGTVEGYVWVKSIQAVPGAKLHAYPDANGVFDDLGAGRIDVGFLDPLIIIAAQKERPGLKIETQYLTPPSAEEVKARPAYAFFRPYMTSFYLPKQAPRLERAISAEIRKLYQSGQMTKLIQTYGGDPNQFLKPSLDVAPTRRGVDRPADWQPPSI
jgi:ABC-type amino acid transport substrate-binding protein